MDSVKGPLGALSPNCERLQLRLQRTHGDFLVPVLGTLLQSRQEFSASADSAGRSGEEQELFGVLVGEPAPDHIEVGDAGNLADAYAARGARPREIILRTSCGSICTIS